MEKKKNKFISYITRGWKDEGGYSSSRLRLLPPFFYELMAYIIIGGVIFYVVKWVVNK